MGATKLKTPLKIICIIIFAASATIQILPAIHLRSMGGDAELAPPESKFQDKNSYTSNDIGEFGDMVLGMLPEDLRFTVFLPSEKAFHRDLRLERNDSNTYAVLTRVLAFSTVPRWISLEDLELGEEKVYDSISGFQLYVRRTSDQRVVANSVVSADAMKKKGSLLIHVMDGVLMDAEFQQSVQTEDGDDGYMDR